MSVLSREILEKMYGHLARHIQPSVIMRCLCRKTKTKVITAVLSPITELADNLMNQLELLANTCTSVAGTKPGKMSASKSQLVLVLFLIG